MNPVYFALLARRRMDLHGATAEDFAAVKVKNSRHGLQNPNARYRKESSIEDVLNSPVVSDPLRQASGLSRRRAVGPRGQHRHTALSAALARIT